MIGEYSGNIYNIFDFKIGSFYGLIIYNLNLIIYSVARTMLIIYIYIYMSCSKTSSSDGDWLWILNKNMHIHTSFMMVSINFGAGHNNSPLCSMLNYVLCWSSSWISDASKNIKKSSRWPSNERSWIPTTTDAKWWQVNNIILRVKCLKT